MIIDRLKKAFRRCGSDSAVAKKAAGEAQKAALNDSKPFHKKQELPPSPEKNSPKKGEEMAVAKSNLDCSKPIHWDAISFEMVTDVITSWEQKVRKIPNWLPVTGELILRKMFELDPEIITIFGFPEDTRFDDPELKNNEIFMTKGIRFMQAVDTAIGFLGPELETLEHSLLELGARHVARKVRPHHWPAVGEALFCVLEVGLGDEFSGELKEAWRIIYNFLGYHMIQGLLTECPSLAEPPVYPAPPSEAKGSEASNPAR